MIRRLLAVIAMIGAMSASATALAQASKDPVADSMPAPPPAEGSGGSPIYGYLAFGALGGLTLAIICRSSRRS